MFVKVIWLFVLAVGDTTTNENTTHEFPRVVWSFWDLAPPEDIVEMVNTAKKAFANFTHRFLASSNLSVFLERLPDKYDLLSRVNKADYVRLALVEKFGGFWMDASTYVNHDRGIEFFFWNSVETHSQLTSVCHDSRGCSYAATYFFGAPKNSIYAKLWRAEYEKAVMVGFDEYRKLHYKIFPDARRFGPRLNIELVQDHLVKTNDERLNGIPTFFVYKNHEYSPFRLFSECKNSKDGRRKCFRRRLQYERKVRDYAFVKVGHELRIRKAIYKNTEA